MSTVLMCFCAEKVLFRRFILIIARIRVTITLDIVRTLMYEWRIIMLWDKLFKAKKDTANGAGTKIRAIRSRKNMSAKRLGELVGVNESAIRNYENGTRNVADDKLAQIADKLEVPKETLVDRQINSYADVIHILFELSEIFEFTPIALPQEPKYVVSTRDEVLQRALEMWFEKRRQWEQGKISPEEFQNWKDAFPFLCNDEISEEQTEENVSSYPDFERIMGLKSAVSSFDMIVDSNVDEILACMQLKDYSTAKYKLEVLRSTIHTLSSVEIKKYG